MYTIDDEVFLEAWASPDNIRMMSSVARNFFPSVGCEDCQQLMRIALLKTLQSHDPTSRRKFISSLRLRTGWLCRTYARTMFRRNRLKAKVLTMRPSKTYSVDDYGYVEDTEVITKLLDHLTPEEQTIIRHRYMDSMSLVEISRRTGMPRSLVGELHKSGMVKLRLAVANHGDLYGCQ